MMMLYSKLMRRSKGNIGDLFTMGIFVLAAVFVMISFMNCIGLLQAKEQVSQLAREYMLVMETEGYLSTEKENELLTALTEAGVSDVSMSGSTFNRVGYGNPIILKISGRLKGKHEICEIKSSTAKY